MWKGKLIGTSVQINQLLHGREKSTKGIKIEINYVLKAVWGKGWEWKRDFQAATWNQLQREGEGTSHGYIWAHTFPFLMWEWVHLQWLCMCLSYSIWISAKYTAQTLNSGKSAIDPRTLIHLYLWALMWLFVSLHASVFQVIAFK